MTFLVAETKTNKGKATLKWSSSELPPYSAAIVGLEGRYFVVSDLDSLYEEISSAFENVLVTERLSISPEFPDIESAQNYYLLKYV